MIMDNKIGFKVSAILGIVFGVMFITFGFDTLGVLISLLYLYLVYFLFNDSHP